MPFLGFMPLADSFTTKVVPLFSVDVNDMSPPTSSRIDLIRYSPNPVPSVSFLNALSARKSFWKILSC